MSTNVPTFPLFLFNILDLKLEQRFQGYPFCYLLLAVIASISYRSAWSMSSNSDHLRLQVAKLCKIQISQISLQFNFSNFHSWCVRSLTTFCNPGCLWSSACQPKEIKWLAALCPCQFLEAGWTGKLRPTLLTPGIFHWFDIFILHSFIVKRLIHWFIHDLYKIHWLLKNGLEMPN